MRSDNLNAGICLIDFSLSNLDLYYVVKMCLFGHDSC